MELACLGSGSSTLAQQVNGRNPSVHDGCCCCCCCCRADPFVEVGLSEKGEHLLGAAGEVHLETVVKDLRERFARVDFQVRSKLGASCSRVGDAAGQSTSLPGTCANAGACSQPWLAHLGVAAWLDPCVSFALLQLSNYRHVHSPTVGLCLLPVVAAPGVTAAGGVQGVCAVRR
jgi:hypothetical protein